MKQTIKMITASVLAVSFLTTTSTYAVSPILTVSNNNNSGAGSLRQAILDANSDPIQPHIIKFAIGSGVQTIRPLTALPSITAPYTIIDGSTQTGWTAGHPVIVLDGSLLTPFTVNGLTISGTNNCLIRALVINNGFNNGILISDNGVGANNNTVTECFIGTNQPGTSSSPNTNGIAIVGSTNFSNSCNTIGGPSASQKNVISGNTNNGILLQTNVNNTTIENNYVGTDLTGVTALPNSAGGIVVIGSLTPSAFEQAANNFIGFNVISGNSVGGVILQANASSTIIQSNLIGTTAAGTVALANDVGIIFEGIVPPDPSNPFNGGVFGSIVSSNTISGNSSHGIFITTNSFINEMILNFIGTDTSGALNLGNGGHGIALEGTLNAPCFNNIIGIPGSGNTIKFNGAGTTSHYGVLVDGDATTPDTLNPIVNNSIFNNASHGIKLANGNNSQTPPTIVNALLSADGAALIITVTAPSTPSGATFNLDFFVNSSNRSPITEGALYVGTAFAVPAGTTTVKYIPLSSPIASGLWLSATAINLNNPGSQPGDTSEHTPNFLIVTLPDTVNASVFENCGVII